MHCDERPIESNAAGNNTGGAARQQYDQRRHPYRTTWYRDVHPTGTQNGDAVEAGQSAKGREDANAYASRGGLKLRLRLATLIHRAKSNQRNNEHPPRRPMATRAPLSPRAASKSVGISPPGPPGGYYAAAGFPCPVNRAGTCQSHARALGSRPPADWGRG